jgi:DNA repair protein RecN (Recombination protein N)
MLVTLQIRNFALIENAAIEFGEGLNILSGETGSGKSIVVQALELLLGSRGSSDLIRQGEEEAEVTGFFNRKGEEIGLRRVIARNGKNRAYLNERPVPVAALEEAGEGLVDLASQHEHQILLRPEKHLPLLDAFAALDDRIEAYQRCLADGRHLLEEREGLMARGREAREKEEFLRFQLKELQEGRVEEGEEERLQKEREVVKNAVRLGEICLKGEEGLDSGEDSVADRLGRLSREVQQAVAVDPEFSKIQNRIEEALCLAQEAAKELRRYGQGLSFDPERLQEIEDRLALIGRLKRKYGGSVEALSRKEREVAESLRLLENFDDEIRRKDEEWSRRGKELSRLAGEISRKRREASRELSRQAEKELKELGMTSARFSVRLEPLRQGAVSLDGKFFGERGGEEAEFFIAPNPGEGERPLAKVASGGELSRIFLALKKVLGEVRGAPTCIFDEVDAGIGGRIAEVVGKNLSLLARKRQVLCVTHLPQIACYADHHFVIQKRVEKGRTQTEVQRLKSHEREEEIARMLAGIQVTDRALAHAKEMLKNAH